MSIKDPVDTLILGTRGAGTTYALVQRVKEVGHGLIVCHKASESMADFPKVKDVIEYEKLKKKNISVLELSQFDKEAGEEELLSALEANIHCAIDNAHLLVTNREVINRLHNSIGIGTKTICGDHRPRFTNMITEFKVVKFLRMDEVHSAKGLHSRTYDTTTFTFANFESNKVDLQS